MEEEKEKKNCNFNFGPYKIPNFDFGPWAFLSFHKKNVDMSPKSNMASATSLNPSHIMVFFC
jgi:hypothetical protein